jgi:surface protein
MIYEELKTIVDSVNDMKEASGASTFTEVKDKVERMPVWDNFRSPLAQLGYTSEDEAIYKDLKIDMTTVKEDVEYSLVLKKKLDGATTMEGKMKNDDTMIYAPAIDTSNAGMFQAMFASNTNMLTAPKYDMRKGKSTVQMFGGCSSLLAYNMDDVDLPNCTTMLQMMDNCKAMTSFSARNANVSKCTNMHGVFQGCNSLTSVDLSGWGTSSVTTMRQMFYGCKALESLDISHFDTTNVAAIQNMFYGCNKLKDLNMSGLNLENVKNMSYAFCNCYALESLDLSGLKNAKPDDIGGLFKNCESLKYVDGLSDLDVSNVSIIYEIFQGCKALENVDVSTWYAPKVTQLNSFATGLLTCKEIDLSSWDLTTVQYMSTTFRGATSLEVIKLKNFGGHPSFAYDRTFENCPAWGSTPEGLQSLRDTLINNSFDRVKAGYSAINLPIDTAQKNLLTDEEKAAITAKGFTIV